MWDGLRSTLLHLLRALYRAARYRGWRIIRPWHERLARRPIITQVGADLMLLDLQEVYNRFLFYLGTGTIEEYASFCASIRPGMTVVDVGANVGVFTLAAARLAGREGHVIAFEPLERNWRYLVANLALNGYHNVVVEPMAVTDHDGTLQMYAFGKDNLSVSREVAGRELQTWSVPSCRLNTYVAQHAIPGVDVIKIDVEGAEAAVLEGMRDLLTARNRPTLVVEIHPDFLLSVGSNAGEVLQRLHSHGYALHHLRRDGSLPIRDAASFVFPYDATIRPYNRFRILATPAG